MLITHGACVLGSKIMIQINNLNTSYASSHANQNVAFIIKGLHVIYKIHIHTIHIFDVNNYTMYL